MKRLSIIGSSDLADQITHLASECNYEVVGCFDDFKLKEIDGKRTILGKISDIKKMFDENVFDEIIMGIGYSHMEFRADLFEKIETQNIAIASLIHPTCIIDKTAKIGKGVILYPGCIIDQRVFIKDNVLLNLGCIIAHDSILNRHSILSPAVKIAGFCTIGEKCNLGINTTIIDNISITDGVQTGASTLVVDSIVKSGLYIGSPAKFHK